MQTDAKNYTLPSGNDCLGCSNCKGLCRDLLDLALLPETVLRPVARGR